MRWWAGWMLLAGCNGKSDDAGDGEGDTDTDTDTDSDTDTDTDVPTAPSPLECPPGPCDGDPTGNWNILGACVDDPRFADIEAECPGNTVTLYGVGIDGTMSFNATDYTFYVNGGTTGIGISIPPECNTGCLNYELPDLGVRCDTTGLGGCECTGSTGTSTWLDSGTWTRSGSTLTLESAATGSSRTIDVCATGDVIWFYDPNRDVSVAGVPVP
jgi:hypothetical protein